MISAKVEYKNLGLSDEQVEVAICCEALAVKLLNAGVPPEQVTEHLLNFLKRTDPNTTTMFTLTRAGMSDEFRKIEEKING